MKKTDDGQKIYSFELSNKNTKEFLRSTIDSPYQNDDDSVYDSSTEAAFAKRFQQHLIKMTNLVGKFPESLTH